MKYQLYDLQGNIYNYNQLTYDEFSQLEVIATGYKLHKLGNGFINGGEVETYQIVSNENYQKLLLQDELTALDIWFEEYDSYVIQYTRHQRLGIVSDINISKLDSEAAVKATRIKQLKTALGVSINEN